MDPLTIAAIMGGTQLLGGLAGSAAQRQQKLMEGEMGAAAMAQKGLQESLAKQEAQQQSALSSLIDAYRASLLG